MDQLTEQTNTATDDTTAGARGVSHGVRLPPRPDWANIELLKRSEKYLATETYRAELEERGWRVLESPRETPCYHRNSKAQLVPCRTSVRVKIIEPGVYARECRKCEIVSYYELSFMVEEPQMLKFRWVTRARYVEWWEAERRECQGDWDLLEL